MPKKSDQPIISTFWMFVSGFPVVFCCKAVGRPLYVAYVPAPTDRGFKVRATSLAKLKKEIQGIIEKHW